MTSDTSNYPRLRVTVEDLCDILERLRQLQEQLLVILSEKEKALVEVRLEDLEALRDREETVLKEVIEEEKQVKWCGCKSSEHAPFCDGTHNKFGK